MDTIQQAVQILNSAQVPVITLDQPLYAVDTMELTRQVWRRCFLLLFLVDCIYRDNWT